MSFYFSESHFTPKDIYKGEKTLNERRKDSMDIFAKSVSSDYSDFETFFGSAQIVNLGGEKHNNSKFGLRQYLRFFTIDDRFDTILLDQKLLENCDEFRNTMDSLSENSAFDSLLIPEYDKENQIYYIELPGWFLNKTSCKMDRILAMNFEMAILINFEYEIVNSQLPPFSFKTKFETVFSYIKKAESILNEKYNESSPSSSLINKSSKDSSKIDNEKLKITTLKGRLFSSARTKPRGLLPIKKRGTLCCPDFPLAHPYLIYIKKGLLGQRQAVLLPFSACKGTKNN